MNKILALTALASSLCTTSAFAAPTIFFGEDLGDGSDAALTSYPNAQAASSSFLSAVTGLAVATENFESFAPTTDYSPLPLNVDFGALGTATLAGDGYVSNESYQGRYAISGTQFWEASASSLTLSFSSAVVGFGFYGIDVNDFGGQMSVTLSNGQSFTIGQPDTVTGSVLYWGLFDLDTPFTSITFNNSNAGSDWFGFDDFTIVSAPANPVPEPSMLALLGIGYMALRFGGHRGARRA